jgi:hypothetical protein
MPLRLKPGGHRRIRFPLCSFPAVLVYRRAVGDGSASNPLGDAVPIPGATRASAFGLAVNDGAAPPFPAVLIYRRAVGDGSASNPLGDAKPMPGATRASALALGRKRRIAFQLRRLLLRRLLLRRLLLRRLLLR